MIRRYALLLFVPVALFAAGCGSKSQSVNSADSATTTTPITAPQAAAVTTTLSPAEAAVLAEITQRGKPTITVPTAPVTTLGIHDDIVGTGATVAAGATVTVHYVGVSQSTGKEFDSSWSRGQTISFPLSGVIKGWTDGLVGMKVGGRRTLTIPGDQAYGPNPPSADIAPNDTLVFTIDLVSTT